MAKKKTNAEIEAEDDFDALVDDMVKSTDRIIEMDLSGQTAWISTGCYAINLALSGHPSYGIPMGRIINLEGESDGGKTLLGLTILREGQMEHRKNFRALIIDTERGIEITRTEQMGLFLRRIPKDPNNVQPGEDDTNDDRASTVRIIQTTDLTTLAEIVMPRFMASARAHPERVHMVFIDSLSMIVTTHERDADFDTKDMARAKEIRKFMRLVNDSFPKNLSIMLVHHQTDIINTTGMQAPAKTGVRGKDIGGGKSVKYVPDVRIEVDYAGREYRGSGQSKRILGQKCRIKVIKTRLHKPMIEARAIIDHNKGFTVCGGLFDQLIQKGLIIKTGKMYQCPQLFGDKKYFENALQDEIEKPDHAVQVCQLIVENLEISSHDVGDGRTEVDPGPDPLDIASLNPDDEVTG